MQINKADFTCPSWLSTSTKKLIKKILDPNPNTVCLSAHCSISASVLFINNSCHCYGSVQRITIAEVINNEWFKKGYQPPTFETADVNLDDVNSIFNESGVSFFSPSYLNVCTIMWWIDYNIVCNDLGPSTACRGKTRRKTSADECFWVDFYLPGPQSWHTISEANGMFMFLYCLWIKIFLTMRFWFFDSVIGFC
jgi:hypothetical protein